MNIPIRHAMIDEAFKHFGKPYVYGGNGPDNFDCSGFALHVLRRINRWPEDDVRAVDIYRHFKKYEVEKPYKGCLVFFSGKNGEDTAAEGINHVVFCVNEQVIIGANGRRERRVSVETLDYRIKKYGLHDLVAFCDPVKGAA